MAPCWWGIPFYCQFQKQQKINVRTGAEISVHRNHYVLVLMSQRGDPSERQTSCIFHAKTANSKHAACVYRVTSSNRIFVCTRVCEVVHIYLLICVIHPTIHVLANIGNRRTECGRNILEYRCVFNWTAWFPTDGRVIGFLFSIIHLGCDHWLTWVTRKDTFRLCWKIVELYLHHRRGPGWSQTKTHDPPDETFKPCSQ